MSLLSSMALEGNRFNVDAYLLCDTLTAEEVGAMELGRSVRFPACSASSLQ
jgi:hypothetical protein